MLTADEEFHLLILLFGLSLGVLASMLHKYLVRLFSILEGRDEEKKQ